MSSGDLSSIQIRVQGEKHVTKDGKVRVDSPHEILVDKLCALLSRSELRDLVDVRGLLETGMDLTRALADAPRRDSGFSPLTLAWVLRGMPIATMAAATGWSGQRTRALEEFQVDLVDRLTRTSDPESMPGT